MAYDDLPPSRLRPHSLYTPIAAFSVICFILTLATDLAYWVTAEFIWETMSVWLLTVGLVAAPLAIVAGIVDLVRSRTVLGLGQPWLVVVGQIVALVLSVINLFVHSRDGYTAVVPQGVTLSFVVVLILLATTIMGRSMAARPRVGALS